VRERNAPSFEIISNQGVEEMDINLKDVLPNIFGQRTKKRKMKVAEAFEYLVQEEEGRLVDMDQVTRLAVERGRKLRHRLPRRNRQDRRTRRRPRPDVSREGVQRDILPIVEGTPSTTRYGMVAHRLHPLHRSRSFHVLKAQRPQSPSCRAASLSASSCNRSPSKTSSASLTEP